MLVVIGIAAGLITVKAMPDNRRLLVNEGERLAQLLVIASQEATLRSMTLAWVPARDGYAFYEVSDAGLQPSRTEDLLKPRRWDVPAVKTQILVDGKARSRFDISPEGQAQAVVIRLYSDPYWVDLKRTLSGRYDIQSGRYAEGLQ